MFSIVEFGNPEDDETEVEVVPSATYDIARQNLLKSTYTSDLSECETVKRASKRQHRYSPGDERSEKNRKSVKSGSSRAVPPPPPQPPAPTSPITINTEPLSQMEEDVFERSYVNTSPDTDTPLITFELVGPTHEPQDLHVDVLDTDLNVASSVGTVESQPRTAHINSGFERYVIEELVNMKSMLKDISNKMDGIAKSEINDETLEFEDGEFNTAKTIAELQCINSSLFGFGGTKCTKMLNRMLHELLLDEVAVHYSYKGQRDKFKFETFEFASIFSACLKQNPYTRKERTMYNIQDGIMAWLKRAPARVLGRKIRSSGHSDADSLY
ncbi:unnamed protein product [Allacma fusca]|uniref:DUF4806 domain-containing protein n=1 Tax=Allacma fusca TaxID=39272 RepID=A0A8J2NRH8_9HEXA|nr:unnamed protein product [Allacma fusca]